MRPTYRERVRHGMVALQRRTLSRQASHTTPSAHHSVLASTVARIFLRLIANCPDGSSLQQIQFAAARELSPWKAKEDHAAVPYWKFSNHFELSYTISPGTETTHCAITALEPRGWDSRTPDKDASCVWNKAADRCFIGAAVVWAELGFLE